MKQKIITMLLAICMSCASVSVLANGFGVEGGNTAAAGSSQASAATMTSPQQQATSTQTTTQIPTATKSQSANVKTSQSDLGNTDTSKEAFSNTVRNLMPLSPEQIKSLRYMLDQSQKAAATYPGGTPPKPTSSSVLVDLSPGAAPPVVRLRAGFVTSLVFLDSTGQAWPIQAYDIGNPKSFNIKWDKKGNTLLVQSMDSYQSGNLAVILKGQNTPVMVTLIPGQGQVDYRVDLRVPGLGPNASVAMSGLPDTANPKLLSFLDGVPPAGSKALQVEGGPCQAWTLSGKLFLRTPLTVLSPSWVATMSSPDGTHVYEVTKTPVVLASSRGHMVQLQIKGL